MKQTQVSWRHHYIPQFYLKRWANNKGQLVEFSKPYGPLIKPQRRYPSETGFMDKLYAIEGVPEHLTHYFELKFFRPVDTMASVVLDKMERGGKNFSASERTAWGRFILSDIPTPRECRRNQGTTCERLFGDDASIRESVSTEKAVSRPSYPS